MILASLLALVQTPPLEFVQREDRIALIGNTTAERMALSGHFEAGLHAALPDHDLRLFNLGWSGDEVDERPRPYRFAELHDDLDRLGIDLALLFFGFNESFDGVEGLEAFEGGLRSFTEWLASNESMRLVLVTPLAAEDAPGLPPAGPRNELLELYSTAIRRVGGDTSIPLVDLFGSSRRHSGPALTFNGVHVNEYGDWFAARVLLEELGLGWKPWRLDVPAAGEAVGIRCRARAVDPAAPEFELELERLPSLTPPRDDGRAEEANGTVSIDLPPGTWELAVDGRPGPRASSDEWRRGVALPEAWSAARLLELVVERADLFFHRWRPVNGEYVYGRRASPFGIVSFPPEMERLDELIEAVDARIRRELEAGRTLHLEWKEVR